jgi:hypothetical protein
MVLSRLNIEGIYMSTPPQIDQLRNQYTQTPYMFDMTMSEYEFSKKEKALIERYGNWFEAIWNGEVPLHTDKLKHFYAVKEANFQNRIPVEEFFFVQQVSFSCSNKIVHQSIKWTDSF